MTVCDGEVKQAASIDVLVLNDAWWYISNEVVDLLDSLQHGMA